jgi:hypothetical protein
MRVWRFLRGSPCAVLLVVQLLGVVLYPYMEGSVAGRSLLALFGLVVLGLTVLAVRVTPVLTWVAFTLALPAVVLLAIEAVTASDTLIPWSSAFEAVLYVYAAVSMLLYMLSDDIVTVDELFAIGAVFTLLAWAFAYVYTVVQALAPGSFTAAVRPEDQRTWVELLFLSFTTLSSTGLSDVVPVQAHARSAVMIEQVAGVFYIAMVVTRLVTLRGRHASRLTGPADERSGD